MNRILARTIVDCLSLSNGAGESLQRLKSFSLQDWHRTLPWLHESGLALYFWKRAKDAGCGDMLPREVRTKLEGNLRNNCCRLAEAAEEFGSLNRRFEAAGITYAVIKGFALVPEYCPDAALRCQSDLDYLIRPEFGEQADQLLRAAGFVLKRSAQEVHPLNYVRSDRPPNPPQDWDGIYSARLSRPVELHFRLWEVERERIPLESPEDPLRRVRPHDWHGLRFITLADEDMLAYQAMHALRHILNCWCRLSLFLEIACFLKYRSSDAAFWMRFRERIRGRRFLPETVGVAFSLASGLFGSEVPDVARDFTVDRMTPAMRAWVKHYGLSSALDNFSSNKLNLYLHREFTENPGDWKALQRQRLLPLQQPHRAFEAAGADLPSRWSGKLKQLGHILGRLRFHFASAVRYAWEFPKWRRLRGAEPSPLRFRDASDTPSIATALPTKEGAD